MDNGLPAVVPVRVRTAADGRADQGTRTTDTKGIPLEMQKVLVSGSAGFIGGYVVEELLKRGYDVVGIENYSKYGKIVKSYDGDPRYHFTEGDARDVDLM